MLPVPAHLGMNAAFDFFRTSLIHVYLPPVDDRSVQAGDGGLCFDIAVHLNKGNAARSASISIRDYLYAQNLPKCLEGRS